MPAQDIASNFGPQITSAFIAGVVSAATAFLSIVLQIFFRILDAKDKKKQAILEKRQETLLLALDVIDHVYANTSFNGAAKSNVHEWDISIARTAMNHMILYCENPKRTVEAFSRAIGLYNPDTQTPQPYGPIQLAEFRIVVCKELGLPITNHVDNDVVWISELSGMKKAGARKKQ